jgi:hypothetical protein
MLLALQSALQAIPAASVSNRALLAYAVAIAAWTVIAFRVRRNKNLLKHLTSLPEKDRLPALELEMGSVRVPKDLTPEQWLRGRIHQYYFWSFVLLAVLAAAVIVIAYQSRSVQTVRASVAEAFNEEEVRRSAQQAQEETKRAERKVQEEAERARIEAQRVTDEKIGALNSLSLGISREFLISHFGQPTTRENFKGLEDTPGQYAHFEILTFENDLYSVDALMYLDSLHDYTVILHNDKIHPAIPEIFKLAFGEFTFSQLDPPETTDEPRKIEMDSTAWGYVEVIKEEEESEGSRISIAYSGVGASYSDYQMLKPNPLTQAVRRYGDEADAEQAWESAVTPVVFHMTPTWISALKSHDVSLSQEVSYFRQNVYPNCYRVESLSGWYVADKAPYPIAELISSGVEGSDPVSLAEHLYRTAAGGDHCNPRCPVVSGD